VGSEHAKEHGSGAGRAKQAPPPKAKEPEPKHWVLGLQRSAGNAAVTSLLDPGPRPATGAPRSPAPARNAAGGTGAGSGGPAAPVQRDTGTAAPTAGASATASFTIPASLTGGEKDQVVTDREGARAALLMVSIGLDDRAGSLDADGEAALHRMAKLTRDEAGKLATPGALSTSDASYLNGFVAITAAGEQQAFEQAVGRLLDLFKQAEPTPEEQAQIEGLEDQLAEALHQRFIAHQKDELKQLIELDGKIKEWNGKVGEYAGKAADHAKDLEGLKGAADVAKRAQQLKDLSKSLGEKLGKAKEILEIANDVATIAGAQGSPDGTAMMQGIQQFSAGIDLVDKSIGKFAEAVPLFKDLWSNYYKPLVDGCIKGLTKLAGLMEVKDREDVVGMWNVDDTGGMLERDGNGAPVIPKLSIAKGIFPGGQPVFSYLYCLREGREAPPMPEAVKVFFLDRHDIMNEIASGKDDELTSDWKLFSPSTWSSKGRITNLVSWLPGHWQTVWSMLYGEYGRYVPH
jgi:hypothetical protein